MASPSCIPGIKDLTPCKKVYKKFSPNIIVRLLLPPHRYVTGATFLQESSDTEGESTEGTNTELASRALRGGGGTGETHGGLKSELAWFVQWRFWQSRVAVLVILIQINATSRQSFSLSRISDQKSD
jgi:hypothetical protein